jgi:hypothetical protein
MACRLCGGGDRWLKTVRPRSGGASPFTVCDPCYALLAQRVWIIPGPISVTGRCDQCDEFVNPRELAVRRALVKEVYRGVCCSCVAR